MSKERIATEGREIIPGSWFTTKVLSPISKPIMVGGQVEAIREGGFYGRVMLFENEVIKTSEPDAWHKLWRHINWGLSPFPPQSSELVAQLDFLAGKIINKTVPALTNGRVVVPDSFGYTDLGDIGYGQAIERMRGRGARFDTGHRDNEVFSQTREELWKLGVSLGLEHAAQIHPDNPFGKPNLWINNAGQMIWLDVLPAIRHTGWVWPAFNFPFHQEIRDEIGECQLTFNRIHTDRLRKYIELYPERFSGSDMDELDLYLGVYDQVSANYSLENRRGRRELIIDDALRRGIVSSDQANKIMKSDVAFARFLAGTVIRPGLEAFRDVVERANIYRAFTDKDFRGDIKRFFHNPDFRRQRFIEHTILNGARQAYELGLIDESEWKQSWQVLDNPMVNEAEARKLASTYLGLQAWYLASSSLMNALTVSVGASVFFAEQPLQRLALAGFIEFVLPSIVRASSTALVGEMTNQDLRTAIKVSAVPYLGHSAVVADLARRYGERSEKIWHYTKRGIIASLSKLLRPWGGWNSDLEASLWEKLRVESW